MGVKSICVQDAVRSINNGAFIIDVRESNEFEQAHLEKAFSVPLSTITAAKIQKLNPQNKTILIHCHSGKRSKVAADILLSQDYSGEILELDEGIIAWIDSNQPILSDL